MIVRSVVGSNDWSNDLSHDATIDRSIDRGIPRLIVPSVFGCHDWSYAPSQDITSARTIGHSMSRLLIRSGTGCNDRLIVPSVAGHQSLIATTSRTISCGGSCHRYSPIIRDSATTRIDRSRCATAAGDRSKNCRSVAPWPNHNQSCDPEIVRSGGTARSMANAEVV